MIASVEIASCIVAILGAVKVTKGEYARLRYRRQVAQALRRVVEAQ